MKSFNLLNRSLIVFPLSLLTVSIFSQERIRNNDYQPEVGQEGKDVVWVPTPQALVDKMLNLAKITPDDFLIDLGSGDGRTVISAAKLGTRALGVEYNPDMVELSRQNAAREGVSRLAEFTEADLFEFDFSGATVITMFLLPDINIRLRPQLLDLKPGTRIVSNTFTMQEWLADDTAKIDDNSTRWNTAYLWIVPAKVEGRWILPQGELILLQEFQMISGALTIGNKSMNIYNGKLRGNEITFSVGDEVYTGRVDGKTMEGTVTTGGSTSKWSATR